jgi:predicted small metal-binding protein
VAGTGQAAPATIRGRRRYVWTARSLQSGHSGWGLTSAGTGSTSSSTALVIDREVREFRLEGAKSAKEWGMGKVIDCNQVAPEAGCDHVVRGATEEEALRNAAEHAKEHGIVEVTPELMEKVKAAMHDE